MDRRSVPLEKLDGLVEPTAGVCMGKHHFCRGDRSHSRGVLNRRSCPANPSRRPRSNHIGSRAANTRVPSAKENRCTRSNVLSRSAPASAKNVAPSRRWRRCAPPDAHGQSESDNEHTQEKNLERSSQCSCKLYASRPNSSWRFHIARESQISLSVGKSRSSFRLEANEKAYANVGRLKAEMNRKKPRSRHTRGDLPARHVGRSPLASSSRETGSNRLKVYESAASSRFFSVNVPGHKFSPSGETPLNSCGGVRHVTTTDRISAPRKPSTDKAMQVSLGKCRALSPTRLQGRGQASPKTSTERAASAPTLEVQTSSSWQQKRPLLRAFTQEGWRHTGVNLVASRCRNGPGAPVVGISEDEEASCLRLSADGPTAALSDLELTAVEGEPPDELDSCEPLFAAQEENVNLSLEQFDDPEALGDLPPQEWVRRCIARRKLTREQDPLSPAGPLGSDLTADQRIAEELHSNEVSGVQESSTEDATFTGFSSLESAPTCVVAEGKSDRPCPTHVLRQRCSGLGENKAHSAAYVSTVDSGEDAHVYNYERGGWRWTKCRVLQYLETEKRFRVRLLEGGHEKKVSRPALRFVEEDERQSEKRIEMCRMRKEKMRLRQSLINTIRSLPDENFQLMPSRTRQHLLRKVLVKKGSPQERCRRARLLRGLLWELDDLYKFAMKFSSVKHKVVNLNGTPYAFLTARVQHEDRFGRLFEALLPARMKQCGCKTLPETARPFSQTVALLEKNLQFHRASIGQLVLKVNTRFFEIKDFRFLDVNRGRNREHFLPGVMYRANHHMISSDPVASSLEHFMRHQRDHCSDVKDALAEHWIEFVQNEIMAAVGAMGKACLFYTDDIEKHLDGNLHKVLRKIHLMLSHQMAEFIDTSIEDWKQFFLSFLDDGRHVVPEPLLVVTVEVTGDNVSLVPPPDELSEKLSSLLEWFVEQANSIKGIETNLLPFLKIPQLPLYEISREYAPLVETKTCVEKVLYSCVDSVNSLLCGFQNIAKMLTECRKDMELNTTRVADLRDRLQKIHYVLLTVRSMLPSQARFRLLAVDCAAAVDALSARAQAIWQETCEKFSRHIAEQVSKITASWQDLHTNILSIPADEAELSALKHLIGTLNEHTDPLVSHLKAVHELIDLLSEFGHAIDDAAHIEAFKAYGWPLQIKFDMIETTSILEQGKQRFQAKLEGDKVKLEADLTEYQAALDFVAENMTDVDQAMEYNKKILQLKQNLSAASATVEVLTKAEALFGVEPSDYSRVHDLISAFEPLRQDHTMQDESAMELILQLWSLTVDFKYAEYQWMNCAITTLDPNEIETSLDNWYREAYKLERAFAAADKEKQVHVTDSLRKAIDSFRRRLPLIFSLCNGAFQPRHWNDLLRAINSPLEIDEGFSFSQLLESGIQSHMELVEEKSELAQKEFGLKNSLLKMKSEWKSTQVTLLAYKQTGEYVIKGFEAVHQLLEDHLMRTQSMRGSKYIKCVEHQSREWESKLLDVQQLFISLESFQRSLLYLHPIFHSKDVSQQLPEEADVFKSVESCWRGIMQQALESPGPLEIAEIDNVSHHVSESNASCTRILRALSDYLEVKRLAFPRFFLLSNDELLDILSQTKNPYAVQPHLNKCFEGVHTISLTEDLTSLESVCSLEGEELRLVRPVSLKESGTWKKAETWLGEVEDSLSDTVRHTIEEAMKIYPETERRKWCLTWPEQVVLTVRQLFWTSETTEAIEQASLDVYLNKCNGELQELVKLVRGPLTELQRLTATTLLATDVHARDVVEDLREKGVVKTTDFEWLAQLRCYWQLPDSVTLPTGTKNRKSELKLEMLHAHLFYGFEYLGNTERLVVTPLTDRCYRTLVTAYHLQYGGAPEGPAGTGKTETVKDLAKAVGRQCLVFNCSDGLDYLSIGRIFKGLTSSGAWGCFDEFNRIEVEVLSVVAQQIHSIQQAIRNQAKVFVFEGTDIKLAPSCTINVTMNPGYAGRSELPDNLKALFRPCAMMVPDFFLIAEVYLYSTGFANARSVARKVLSCLKLSSHQFSAEKHYDFGMRYLKAILRAAARLKQQYGDSTSEDALALFAVEKTTLGKLAPADLHLFNGIVSDLFLGVEPVNGESALLRDHLTESAAAKLLQPTENFITKCTQLWDTVQNRHGLMLLGAALSGKTNVLECLSAALESLSKVSSDYLPCTTYSINPKSLTLEQLYGKYDASTQEWTDGIVSLTTRTATQRSDNRRKWIIFDGPVDANWIENMNTVLDDNKKLCLTSGEIIKLSPITTMMFEVEDLASVSPATVSRCGMVYLDQSILGWEALLQSWIQLKLKPTDAARIPFLQNIAEHSVPVFLEFLRTNCETPVQVSENWLVISVLRLYEALADAANSRPQNDTKTEKNLQYLVENIFLCTLVWTIGACVTEANRFKFDAFFRKFVAGNPELATEFTIVEAPYKPRALAHSIPQQDTVYDYFFDGSSWISIEKRVPQLTLSNNADVHSILVPTVDTTRNVLFLQAAVKGGLHVLLAGPTGTGKTKIIASQLKNGFDRQKFTSLSLCLSAKSTANDTQDVIDAKMDRNDGGVYTAATKRQCLIFLDDISAPTKDAYGSQPVIELLRQCLSSGGWYDRSNWRFKQLRCFQFLAAMGPPERGISSLSQRFLRHFNMVYLTPLSHESLNVIYQTLLRMHFSAFSPEIQRVVGNVTKCLVDLHERVCSNLISTPSKPHYVFSLRDLTRITLGLCASSVDSLGSSTDLYKCCIHECERVYSDRLISKEDKETVRSWLREALKENIRRNYEDLVPGDQPLLFCSFVDAQKALYQQRSLPDVQQAAENYLEEYNKINVKRPLNLVFFAQAVKHLTRTVRILCQPCGNALLVGLGGSGRKSLTKLASFIAGHDLCVVEPTVSYSVANWREDLKSILVKTGCHLRNVTFMLTDTQLENEDFLQDTASILSSGEVPNIFTVEDKIGICDILSQAADASGTGDGHISPSLRDTPPSRTANSSTEIAEPEEFFSAFVTNCQQHLHVVLFFSPSGATFRQRLQTYPALIKCCTMDWYNPWSKPALQDVAEAQLKTVCLGEQIQLPKLCHVFAEMQLNVTSISLRFNQEMRKFYYVTPTSYKAFLNFFEEISVKKKESIERQQNQLSLGLDKLESASLQIAQIRGDLESLKPQLEQASIETASLMSSIANMQKEAAATKATVQAEEAVCDQQATNATRVKEQCHEELQQAMPALLVAIEALKRLSKADITELNSLKSPPSGVVKVMVALCKMFNVSPVRVKGPDGFSKVEDYWTAAKKHLLSDTRLLQKLFSYDRDNIPAELMRDIAPYLRDPDFNPDVIRKASVAATSLCKWVRAIIVYDQVAKGVEPKKAALRSAEAALATAAKNLENKKAELTGVQTLVNRLLNEQRAAQKKKDVLKRQFDECNAKLQVAEGLLRDLASERKRWMASFDALKEQTKTLLGELLLTSGVIAYNGVFTSSYRQQCISSWFQSIIAGDIPVPAKYDLQTALGEPLQIQQWICNLLPNDSVSIENAIILVHSKRWPMLIDPQKQATRWLKKSNPAMKVLRASDRKYFGKLKTAIEMGMLVFLEHCSDNLDPALNPILARNVFKTGNINVIRLQEVNVEYASGFKLYLGTNLPNPHFTPEVCAELTMLNFSVTLESLEDQLLNTILSLEHPDVEAKRQVLLAESATNKQQLMALEEKILLLLSNAKGNVLDDTELLAALSSSKLAAQGIGNRVSELEKTQEVLHATRAGYQPVAHRGAQLYAVLLDLGFVGEMYQFSAEWYIAIFTQAIENVRMADNTASGTHLRLEQVDKQFLVLLYDNVCRSLFAKHKFVFSLMLAFKIKEISGHLNYKQLQIFLKGGATSSGNSVPKPPQTDWLPDVAWDRLTELEEAGEIFEKLIADFASSPQEWKAILNEPDPTKLEWPHSLRESTSELEHCLVIQALRPDCLLKCMKNLVEDCLGREFLESPPFDLLYSYKLTTPTRPLLFLLSSGADPMEEILKLAQAQRIKHKLRFVSLGQGQGQRAAAAIDSAVEAGAWTLLQNCHLGSGFLPDLERIVEDLSFRHIHPDFRLLLTSMPTSTFPVTILLNSVKITSEVPCGLRQNIQRTYRSFDSKFLLEKGNYSVCRRDRLDALLEGAVPQNEHPKPEAWKKLLFGLSFFHALLTERRRFGPLGWNVSYEFSQNDFNISVQQLRQLLADLDSIPWDMLKYLTAEINYGGRIIDPWDRRLINCIVEDIYNPQILEDKYKLCEAENLVVTVPPMLTVEEYLSFIEDLPYSESPEYNTLHPNADLTVAIAEGNAILDAVLSSKPRSSGKESSWSFADPTEIARVIEEQLPPSMEIRAAQRRYTVLFKETLLPVLLQELTRFNLLLTVTHKHLKAYQDAVEGKALLTPALEEFGTSLINNRVPYIISAAAYPSSKSLSSWVKDLLERLDFFQAWLTMGPPSIFWISAFFRPQSFLTAVLQHHARDTEVPVDEIDFDFEVLPVFANTGEEPEKADRGSYIYGLYMDGARWSLEEQIVTEPFPTILYYEMPIIWLKPVETSQRSSKTNVYDCPVYRTPARAGSLSTSGISTNYILAVCLPIGPYHEPRYWTKRGVALLAQLSD